MSPPDGASGRLAHDRAFQTCTKRGFTQEPPHAGAASLFVAREQHGHILRRLARRPDRGNGLEDGGDGSLGVGRAKPREASVRCDQRVRRCGVAAVGRHGIDVRVQQQTRTPFAKARVDKGVPVDIPDIDRGRAQIA